MLPERRRATATASEALADHFLALGPQRLGVVGIERVRAHAAADGQVGTGVDSLRDVAVLAVVAADGIGGRNHASPDAGGGALRDGLPLEGLGAGLTGGLQAVEQTLADLVAHVAAELGLDAAR